MQLHVITGLPRSGSTLLCNVLNQNPKFWATSTSTLPGILSGMRQYWSQNIEIKNLLEKEKVETYKRMDLAMRGYIDGWHQRDGKEVIFDKSRAWSYNAFLLKQLYPNAKIIVCVRDLRNVFSSTEKQHRKQALLDEAPTAEHQTILKRADTMFSINGLIGGPLRGIEDLLRRYPTHDGIYYVRFEEFAQDPDTTMRKIYELIGEPYHAHNFDNVVNTANDPDGHYLWKYPHGGEGKISPGDPKEYEKFMTPDIANLITTTFKDFNAFFGYDTEPIPGTPPTPLAPLRKVEERPPAGLPPIPNPSAVKPMGDKPITSIP